ncbi:hypothetical protein M011DRAFT_468879 [Sporormia fimetaria CBS 119925]|uniref:RING-type E3 ubiquitin transferase n=1 Tax=Sporormia fimetaria CBS 119925 TaxID=1340428 RepID=A0A6A6V673_9PLEO|nr:hypothetical protein M011DRAFT_468879 [Sporormia fimetaria CBS 119925]
MSRNQSTAPLTSTRSLPHAGPTPAMDHTVQAETASGKHLPSIRLIPHQEARPGRPSLQFQTMTRTLPDDTSVIKVGRYSERDSHPEVHPNVPSAAPVGFKSKVVSRKHCELWCRDGQWYIKDVKSSSGTFLNRIRLSQPNTESKPFRLKDGDIIQLGIDFRGGEEMIFRCVKIRVECNRGWQQSLNTFNKQTHLRLRNLTKAKKESDSASTHTSECSICLMSIAPCQSLFVAPCSHVWHYKCIRPILNGPTWPNFLCPNCRAVADLEADVEDMADLEDWDDLADEGEEQSSADPVADRQLTPRPSASPLEQSLAQVLPSSEDGALGDLAAAISAYNLVDTLERVMDQHQSTPATPERFITPPTSSSVTQPVAIQYNAANENSGLSPLLPNARSGLAAGQPSTDCPMTPRNDAGPFVLDGSGSAGRDRPSHPLAL